MPNQAFSADSLQRGICSANFTPRCKPLRRQAGSVLPVNLALALMKQWLVYPLVAATVTGLICAFTATPLAWAALVAFLGWPILVTIITADEELPGGWANLDGLATPQWKTPEFRGQMFGGTTVVALAFALQERSSAIWLWSLLCVSLIFGALSAYFLVRAFQRLQDHVISSKG